jgi:hypothetical protein
MPKTLSKYISANGTPSLYNAHIMLSFLLNAKLILQRDILNDFIVCIEMNLATATGSLIM